MYSLYRSCSVGIPSPSLVLLFIVLWVSLGILFQLTSPSLYTTNSAQQHTFFNLINRLHLLWGNQPQEDNPDGLVHTIWSIQHRNQRTFQRQYHLNRGHEESRTDSSPSISSARWPCLWGMDAITTSNEESSMKWGCGISYLQELHNEECVVYSFGSHHEELNIEFELKIIDLMSDCELHVFESDAAESTIVVDNEGMTAHYWNGTESLSKIMDRLGHSHLDILNVNTDREQIPILFAVNPPDHWPSIGQMNLRMKNHAPRSVINFLENQSLRIYNVGNNAEGMTFAFIQKEWNPNHRRYVGKHTNAKTLVTPGVPCDATLEYKRFKMAGGAR